MGCSSTSVFKRLLGRLVVLAAVIATAESYALSETVNDREPCSVHQFQCLTSDACIPKEWRCDGDRDCSDGSDENNCTAPCTERQFLCGDGFCVGRRYICDGNRDCADGSDEANCTHITACSHKEFACANGTCVPNCWLCDGYNDCADGSDEEVGNCRNITTSCRRGLLRCRLPNGGVRTVPIAWVCDGDKDCPNGYDEENCVKRTCTEAEFTCRNGDCIKREYRCDGGGDCKDRSDEEDCESATCREIEFRCKSGQCIPNEHTCDLDHDCSDRSDEDEAICPKGPTGCPPKQFACKPHNGNITCVRMSFRCDEEKDCPDGSDEEDCEGGTCAEEEFRCRNGGCIPREQRCNGTRDCSDGSDEGDCNELRMTFF
ncbi:hypothetical protein HPB48_021572 [Haemaphysalis longicornis]|uniref:Low-density lipoprotein receptor n=1 Tax=Haemaphysalis longicornis TaxID=44386 RepID=A0A9J6FQG2_HAELO|nr:hypothetical protein HPB48_021572 [Haemaphysalis longicornis]